MVHILMASYNGKKYIVEQLESILNQTYQEWKLYIRDDLSKDGTEKILSTYAEKYPEKIILVPNDEKNLGCIGNFNNLLKYSDSEYFMFADQDDIWKETKVEESVKLIKKIEKKYGKEKAALVFTDLTTMDENGNILDQSMNQARKFQTRNISLTNLLFTNVATGCTMIFNESLRNLAGEVPGNGALHDYWYMMVANTFGHVRYLDKPTIYYRQHGNNTVGANVLTPIKKIKYLMNIKAWKQNFARLDRTYKRHLIQAEYLLIRYKDLLSEKQKSDISQFLSIPNNNRFIRYMKVKKMKANRDDFFTNLYQWVYFTFILKEDKGGNAIL